MSINNERLLELALSVECKAEELSHDAKLLRMLVSAATETEFEDGGNRGHLKEIWKISY